MGMDALMAALVTAIVIHATDRTPWLIAGLGARYRQHLLILIGVAGALAAVNALATIGGAALAPRLTPNARALFLALALAAAGLGCFGTLKPPESFSGWRTGPLLTPLVGMLTLGFGSAQFVAMALALRSGTSAFAAIGATPRGAPAGWGHPVGCGGSICAWRAAAGLTACARDQRLRTNSARSTNPFIPSNLQSIS